MDAGHLLTNRDFQRVGDAVRRVEGTYNIAGESAEQRGGSNVQVLQIQAGAANDFGYPARIQKWSSSAGTWSDLSTTEVRVEDPNGGVFAATAYCVARFLGINAANVGCFVAKVGTLAAYIRFALPSALAATDASKAACTVDDFWGGTSPGATVTVYNLPASSDYMFSGLTGAKGLAVYDEIDNKYLIVQLECTGSDPRIVINSTEVLGGDTNGLIYTDGDLAQTASGTRIVSGNLELQLGVDRWVAFTLGSY